MDHEGEICIVCPGDLGGERLALLRLGRVLIEVVEAALPHPDKIGRSIGKEPVEPVDLLPGLMRVQTDHASHLGEPRPEGTRPNSSTERNGLARGRLIGSHADHRRHPGLGSPPEGVGGRRVAIVWQEALLEVAVRVDPGRRHRATCDEGRANRP